MDFTKFHCPVCNKNFLENDDVVVCPECGTPHHRECYKLTGKCFNEALHGTDISVDNFKNPEEEKTGKIPHFKPEENSSEATAKNDENPFKININGAPDFIKFASAQDHLIEGKHSSLFEAAVGKNQFYYIPKFNFFSSYNKKVSFNFIAFLAPLTWSLYRKMYKISALIFAGYLMIFGISFLYSYNNAEFILAANEFVTEVQEQPELYADFNPEVLVNYEENYDSLTVAQKKVVDVIKNMTVLDYAIMLVSVLFLNVLRYAPKILLFIFGNRLYFKKLYKDIDKAEKQGLSGDKLKVFLYKKCGTLPFIVAAFIGALEIYFLMGGI